MEFSLLDSKEREFVNLEFYQLALSYLSSSIALMAESSRLAQMENDLREMKEQHLAFQERIDSQLAKMLEMIKKTEPR